MANGQTRMYEAMFLVDAAQAGSDWDGTVSAIQTILSRAGAEVASFRKWDERRLAYTIKGCKRGTYILSYIKCDPTKIAGIERDVQLSEMVLRVLVLEAEKIPQSVIDAATPAERQDAEPAEGEGRDGDEGEKPKSSPEAVSAPAPAPFRLKTTIRRIPSNDHRQIRSIAWRRCVL